MTLVSSIREVPGQCQWGGSTGTALVLTVGICPGSMGCDQSAVALRVATNVRALGWQQRRTGSRAMMQSGFLSDSIEDPIGDS